MLQNAREKRTPVRASSASFGINSVHFTYDDHRAGTAMKDAPGQPNRIRAVLTSTGKYAVYFDPSGRVSPEFELYDLDRDPLERENLVDVRSGAPRGAAARELQRERSDRLAGEMAASHTTPVTGLSPVRY